MSMWVDIVLASAASATTVSIIGGAVYKAVSQSVKRAVGTELVVRLVPVLDNINERFDANDQATDAAVDKISEVRTEQERIKLDLATQFGGNGGGMREAINGLGIKLGVLQGAFDQHVKESKGG